MLRVTNDYPTIQAAIDAADTNDLIAVNPGVYPEQLVLNKPLALEGSGSGADGTILSGTVGTGISISAIGTPAEPVRVRGLRIRGFSDGISSEGAQDLLLDGLVVTDISSHGWSVGNAHRVAMRHSEISHSYVGIWVDGTVEVDGFELDGCSLNDNDEAALYSQAKAYAGNHFQNVVVKRSRFNDNRKKGMYLEKVHRAWFEDVTVNHSGWDAAYNWAAGIDVNLKYRTDYSDLVFTNVRVVNCGTGALNGVGLTVKARDDGGYANPRAALSNVTIAAAVFTNNETAIRFGETGKTNAGPENVTVTFATILGSRAYGLLNETLADITATNIWWGTTNRAAIAAAVYDRADNPVKGLVTVDPVCAGFEVDIRVTGCGTVTNAPVAERYGPMMDLALTAYPCEGWLFVGWSNGLIGTSLSTNVPITRDLAIDAHFTPYVPSPFVLWVR